MKDLRLALADTDFDELLDTARSLIPTLAPDWTDHNIHDPGIMLAELIAWIAEAQIYSLGRLRRDERRSYAALSGVRVLGPQPARGLVWPSAPAAGGMLVTTDTVLSTDRPDAPAYRCDRPIMLTAARLVGLRSRLADHMPRDWTRANAHAGASFAPFNDPPDASERLELELDGPLWSAQAGPDTMVSIGIEIDSVLVDATATVALPGTSTLQVSQVENGAERLLSLALDTTAGLLHSGVLLLSRPAVTAEPAGRSTVVIRSVGAALLRSPRIRRLALNVLPVVQLERVSEEVAQFGIGTPNQRYRLQRDGLMPQDLVVESIEATGSQRWKRTEDLADKSPEERVFMLDPDQGVLLFGNGLNGAVFPAGSALRLEYVVTAGVAGKLAADARWTITGASGEFGSNREPIDGGRNLEDLARLRQLTRQRLTQEHPLVTSADLQEAALAMSDLGVARAMELPAARVPCATPRGLRVLLVAAWHGAEGAIAESQAWLAAIAARLGPRLPLGQRLQVIGPRYVGLRVTARLVAADGADPAAVASAAMHKLRTELAAVNADAATPAWPFGRDVSVLAVRGWLRLVADVTRVADVQLSGDGVAVSGAVSLGLTGLPRLLVDSSDISVNRAARRP